MTSKSPLRVPGTQLVMSEWQQVWPLLVLVPIDSDRPEKMHKSCSVAHWKESRGFTLEKLPLKLAFIGKLTASLNIQNWSRSFSERLTAGWRDFHQCSPCCFIANKMLLLAVKQLQLIFNSCTNEKKGTKEHFFLMFFGKGEAMLCCFPGKGRKGKCYCPSAMQKLQGTHLWLDDPQSSDITCAHWAKGKFSLTVWFRFTSRINKLRRKM